MKAVFVDTLYRVAVVRPGDPWAEAARKARGSVGDALLVTTDEVLTEFLAALSRSGPRLRRQAAAMVRAIQDSGGVRVVPQSRETFLAGLGLYERRADKEYSLTDCVSMETMRSEGISEALTNDHHFTQEGFQALIKEP